MKTIQLGEEVMVSDPCYTVPTWCQHKVKTDMKSGVEKIVVSNTFTTEWEMESYFEFAKEFGYKVFTLIVENRHGGTNTHNVPEDKIEQMKNRFSIKL